MSDAADAAKMSKVGFVPFAFFVFLFFFCPSFAFVLVLGVLTAPSSSLYAEKVLFAYQPL
jgi:hypothetical protein